MKTTTKNPLHYVIVNDQELQLSPHDIAQLDAIEISKGTWHILKDAKSVQAALVASDFHTRTYHIKVNDHLYAVHINNPLEVVIKALGFELGSNKQIHEVKAPMPGLILEVNVQMGQQVDENDPLLILEAMKMENVIVSPRAGTIKAIAVQKGHTVEKNQLLVEFE